MLVQFIYIYIEREREGEREREREREKEIENVVNKYVARQDIEILYETNKRF
jgi:hypothetical protein